MALALTPRGVLHVDDGAAAAAVPVEETWPSAAVRARVIDAFARGTGAGLLQLGAVEVATELPPTFAWARELARLFLTRLCGVPTLEDERERVELAWPGADEGRRLVEAAPPMTGAEYLDEAVL